MIVLANRTKCALSSLIPLMQFTPSKLRKMFSFKFEEDRQVLESCNRDRIAYLSKKLQVCSKKFKNGFLVNSKAIFQCSELETCNLISKHNFLLYIPLQKLDEVLNLFEGITYYCWF